MLAMRIKPIPLQSFSCNCAAVEALRGDYDGDEINIHFPQNPHTVSELSNVMDISRQLVSGQASKPVVKLIHDSIVTAFWLTRHDKRGIPVILERSIWQQLVAGLPMSFGDTLLRISQMENDFERLKRHMIPMSTVCSMTWEEYRYTGLALLSLLLPPNMCFEVRVRAYNKIHLYVFYFYHHFCCVYRDRFLMV